MTAVDVAVVGGGIVGTSIAAFLADAGLTVRLYERTAIASAASGRNSGVVQHPFDPVLVGLYHSTLDAYAWLAEREPGFSFAAEPAGLLYVGHDPALARRVANEWQVAWPATDPTVLAGAELGTVEPALAADLVACRLAIGYPVAPASATEAFAAVARRSGVEILLGEAVTPAVDGLRVVGVRVDGGVETAGAVVVAAGPWTPEVVDPGGAWRPIRTSWGVVASIAFDAAPRHALEAIDIEIEPGEGTAGADDSRDVSDVSEAAVAFSLVPAAGSSSLGSTFLAAEPDAAAWLPALRRAGSRYIPAIAEAPVLGLRHCARPVSRDGRPLAGPAPWLDGLWIVGGHGPWGISTGPGTARLVADAIAGRGDGRDLPSALAVDRFRSPSA